MKALGITRRTILVKTASIKTCPRNPSEYKNICHFRPCLSVDILRIFNFNLSILCIRTTNSVQYSSFAYALKMILRWLCHILSTLGKTSSLPNDDFLNSLRNQQQGIERMGQEKTRLKRGIIQPRSRVMMGFFYSVHGRYKF